MWKWILLTVFEFNGFYMLSVDIVIRHCFVVTFDELNNPKIAIDFIIKRCKRLKIQFILLKTKSNWWMSHIYHFTFHWNMINGCVVAIRHLRFVVIFVQCSHSFNKFSCISFTTELHHLCMINFELWISMRVCVWPHMKKKYFNGNIKSLTEKLQQN